jgi:hypothetical protein
LRWKFRPSSTGRNRLQRRARNLGQIQPRRQRLGLAAGFLRPIQPKPAGATLCDGLVEQALRRRHTHQRGHLGRTTRLAEDRDIAGIATERRGVVTHPAQRRHQVQHPGIAGVGEAGIAATDREVAEHVEAMIDRHHHDVAAAREMAAVKSGSGSGAADPSPAMQPHHDRAAPVP